MAQDKTERGIYSAAHSAMGFMYQIRFALVESLRRLRKNNIFAVSVETLDDVVYSNADNVSDLMQTKLHIDTVADLSDFSVDLWKTFRIWCEQVNSLPADTIFTLITTAEAKSEQAAAYLRADEKERDIEKAIVRLNSAAASSTNKELAKAFSAYRALSKDQKTNLFERVYILDSYENMSKLNDELEELMCFCVERRNLKLFVERFDGWWFRRCIRHLQETAPTAILSEEIASQLNILREQFKQDSLPIDDEIMNATVDASGYQDHIFVEQLRLIEIIPGRIFHAIRNYYRAFEQRSRWIREDLILIGELNNYERILFEEWDAMFLRMEQSLGKNATEEQMITAAQTLYAWVESNDHKCVRTGVTESSIARGTYHMLSEKQKLGWHIEFKDRIKKILESRGQGK